VGLGTYDEVVHDVVVVVVDVQAIVDADEAIVNADEAMADMGGANVEVDVDGAMVGIDAEVVDRFAMGSLGNVEHVQVHDEAVVQGDSEVGVEADETLSCTTSAMVHDIDKNDLPVQRSDKIAIVFPRQM
jgi:hypothetical protein